MGERKSATSGGECSRPVEGSFGGSEVLERGSSFLFSVKSLEVCLDGEGWRFKGWDMHELGASWLVFRELVNTRLLHSNDIADRALAGSPE